MATSAGVARGQSGQLFQGGLNLDYLTHHTGVLVWKAGCVPGSGPTSSIERMPSGGGTVSTYFQPPTCDGSSVRSRNVAVDAARRVYWATQDGRIVRLDAAASPGTAPVTLANLANNSALLVVVSLSPTYIYWAETFGELADSGSIYRAPIGGGARQTVFNLTSSSGGGAVSLHALGNTNPQMFSETILFRRSFGRLARGLESIVLPGQDPWSESTVVNSIDTFTVANGRIYYAEVAAGSATNLRSRNVSGIANVVTHATVNPTGTARIPDLTVDSTAIYWRQLANNTGPIFRQTFSGGTPEAITLPIPQVDQPLLHLVSDGRHLFWRQNQAEIYRLPVSAAAIVFDFVCDALEVVQTVQSPLNDVPMVADKETWARALGKFSTPGSTIGILQGFRSVQLYGTRAGVPLPGSPLDPVGGSGLLGTIEASRDFSDQGSWFRLPPEWTAWSPDGAVELRAEFNADRLFTETDFSDNAKTATVTFHSKPSIHLHVQPLRTHLGTVDTLLPAWQRVIDMAGVLFPIPELSISFGDDLMEEWQGPLPWDFGPYELSESDNDTWWVIFKLGRRSIFGARLGLVHEVTFFRPFPEMAYLGRGSIGWPKVLMAAMDDRPSVSGYNDPIGGPILAHELAHNYDRHHVDCEVGGAEDDDLDANYPYNNCRIANFMPAPAYQGWNPLARTVIRGDMAGDLMTYKGLFDPIDGSYRRGGSMWTSAYTWNALFNELGGFQAAPPPAAGPVATPRLLLGAVVSDGGVAEIHPATPLPDTASDAAAARMVTEAADHTTWTFSLRRSNGTVLATIPTGATRLGSSGGALVHAVTTENPEAATLVLLRSNAPGIPQATLAGGGLPPTLAITQPPAGTVVGGAFTLRWAAADPESQPLRFQVRHSNDQGVTWRMIADDVRRNELAIDASKFPGGAAGQAQIEVLASDGLRTATARSSFFTIPPKAPVPRIVMQTERGRSCGAMPSIPAGETLILHGSASDAEDLAMASASLAWTVNGPNGLSRTGTGREFYLRDLPPGSYAAQLLATDSSGQIGALSDSFSVRAVAVPTAATAPIVNGYGDDAAYLACRHPQHIRYAAGTSPAAVRSVIFGATLYVSVSGLSAGSASPGEFVALSFDPNNSRETSAQAGDIRFVGTRDGEFYSARGNGAGGFSDTVLTTGFTVRVSGDATRWQAEYAIPLTSIGAAAGDLVGMDAAHYWRTFSGDDTHWFSATIVAWNRPRDWADVRLAPDAEDPADIDFDHMADAWELLNFGSTAPDGTGDADGDGASDADEYQAGTNPTAAASRFRISALVREGSQLRLRWPSATGSLYDVETSEDLIFFEPYQVDLPGTGLEMEYVIDLGLPAARKFFRVTGRRCP